MSTTRPERQRGFGVIAAILILVILAGLAAAIATVSTSQHMGSALDLQGARAYQAARSGVEWGVARALGGNCDASTDAAVLDGIAVTVTCTTAVTGNAVEAGLGTIYAIAAVACNPPSGAAPACPGATANPNYVERRMAVLVED